MKIAVIRRRYDPQAGGAERYAAYVVNELVERGHEVTVFAEKYDNIPELLTVVKVPRTVFPSLCKTNSFAKNVDKVLRRDDFDLVFALSRYKGADVYRQAEQVHAVWMPIYYPFLSRFNPRHSGILKLEKQVFNQDNTGCVITNSNLVRSQVVDLFGFDQDCVRVVRNGVDRNSFFPVVNDSEKAKLRAENNIGLDKDVLLFVAGNFKIKGLYEAIDSMAALPAEKREKVVLLIVGGDNPAPFIKAAKRAGVSENLIFAGKQSRMRDFYAMSDLLFYPSLYEPFANVCLEACTCGIPVLTTAQNGSSELIEHGENGFIVDRADEIDEMTKCLSIFIEAGTEDRIEFSQKAIKATDSYSWAGHVDTIEKLFEEIIEKKKK